MIGKITFCRIEPCFMASKPSCGDVSRVRSNPEVTDATQIKPSDEHVDTFTSSKAAKEVKTEPVEDNVETKK